MALSDVLSSRSHRPGEKSGNKLVASLQLHMNLQQLTKISDKAGIHLAASRRQLIAPPCTLDTRLRQTELKFSRNSRSSEIGLKLNSVRPLLESTGSLQAQECRSRLKENSTFKQLVP